MACPSCGKGPVQETTTELCSRKSCVDQATLDNYIASVKKDLDLGIEDPCMDCNYNEITYNPGTFIEIEEAEVINGRPQFLEVHECTCGTTYKFCRE